MRTKEEIEAEERRLKAEYGEVYDAVAEILFRHDPMGINFDVNTDEYHPEVGAILPRLKTCGSAQDVLTVIHEEFHKWFDGMEGPPERYVDIADEVWSLWRKSPLSGIR